MLISYEVTVENLIDRLFVCAFNNGVVFCQSVDNSKLASLASQASNNETIVLPPRYSEFSLIPIWIWSHRREMQITASRCVVLFEATIGIDECFGLQNKTCANFLRWEFLGRTSVLYLFLRQAEWDRTQVLCSSLGAISTDRRLYWIVIPNSHRDSCAGQLLSLCRNFAACMDVGSL